MRALAVAALLVALAPPAGARTYEEKGFATGETRPSSYAVMPVHANITRGRVTDAVPLIEESAQLEQHLASAVAGALASLGYSADADTLAPATLQGDRELQDLVTRMDERYDEASAMARQDPSDIADGRYTVGETAHPVAAAAGADALVMVRALSIIPSKGQRALSTTLALLFGGLPVPPQTRTLVELGIVRADGKLLTLRADVVSGAVLKEQEEVAGRAIAAVLDGFPAAGEPSAWGRKVLKRRAAGKEPPLQDEGPVGTPADQDVLAEFERAYSERSGASPAVEPPIADAAPAPEPAPAAAAEAAPGASDTPASEVAETSTTPEPAIATQAAVLEPPVTTPPALQAAPAPGSASDVPGAPPEELAANEAPAAPEVGSIFDMLPEARPKPTGRLVMTLHEGRPGVTFRNRTSSPVRASFGLGGWMPVDAGAELEAALPARKPWILVIDTEGREVARTACPPAARQAVVVELSAP